MTSRRAFVAGSMMTALGVFRAIRSAGMELGKDVSMIAHDDVFPYLNADTMVPSMSTTRSSIRAAGTRVGELLSQLLAGKPPGEIGEVVTRSDCLMTGYLDDPEASAAALKGGWLHTGDLGSMEADGLLTLRDRSKDLIISGGSNIYPREIEEVLLRHPDVMEVSVIGRPHAEWGEEVVAVVVIRPATL